MIISKRKKLLLSQKILARIRTKRKNKTFSNFVEKNQSTSLSFMEDGIIFVRILLQQYQLELYKMDG